VNGETAVSAELRQVLRDLKLSGVLDTLPERVELARQAHLPYPEFLTVILADEVARRERVSTTVRARTARLDATMTLEGWDDSTEAVFDRDLWAELCTLRFVEARRDLIVMGPVGVGKTFMASALGHIACRRRFTTLAGRCDQILKRLRGSRLDGNHDIELRKLIRVEVLILDDFCLQSLDAADTADIYELIVERHRRATTIVTTNREPPGEWLAAMGDPLLAEAAIDRLTSNAYQLVVDGPSYRQRQRPGRAGQQGPAQAAGPTPVSRAAGTTTAGVKAKPSGRPAAGLDPGSTRQKRATS
jgi:DNA replication protein DnaC